MSLRRGTLRTRLSPSLRSVAHRIGRAAFFAPLMRTVPASGVPPTIRMPSIRGTNTAAAGSWRALRVRLGWARDGLRQAADRERVLLGRPVAGRPVAGRPVAGL